MGDRGIGTRIAVVAALALALSTVLAGVASASRQTQTAGMGAFSDLNYGTNGHTRTVGMGAFSDPNYGTNGHTRTVGMGAFSDPNAFGPVPKVVTVYASSPTHVQTRSWATNWRTVALTIIAALLALSLGLVAIRSRRTQHTLA